MGLRMPICNGRAHTAPVVVGYRWPLCWRCTSISAAIIICSILINRFGPVSASSAGILFAALLIGLGLMDGYRSHFMACGTTNRNRIVYGVMTGIGLSILFL